jgi:phosphatidylglycerol lysyltransferase
VDQDHFQFYLDMGLTVLKIAEEARVSLKSFKLETLASADLKNTYQRFKEKEDYQFEVLPPEGIQPHIASMREVSEAWLSKNKTREKGFSVGFFNEEYLRRFPLAIVRKEGKIAAFTNLLQGSAKEEVGVDLLRSSAEAPEFLVDYLLLEVMLWAKEKGHKWFTLGSAPLLDVAESPLAPFKDQIAETLSPYTPGAKLPDIRKEKERFNPEWSPKYIASSGNLSLQVAFNNIRSLISKGNRVEFKK